MGCGASAPPVPALEPPKKSASADDEGAPDKAKVVPDVPPESRAEAAVNKGVGRMEGALEAVEERKQQVQARSDEAGLVYDELANAETSVLGSEVRLINPASRPILFLCWNPFIYHCRAPVL